jgi:exonuclease SbcD
MTIIKGGRLRILHTADWHLGKTIAFTNYDLLPLQEKVLQKIVRIADREAADIIIIAGDLFDSVNPSGKAERLFTRTLKDLAQKDRPVIIIAGNHDSPERLSALNPLAMENLIFIGGFANEDFSDVEIRKGRWVIRGSGRFLFLQDNQSNRSLTMHLLPYTSEYRLGDVFFSHGDVNDFEYAEKVRELIHAPIPFETDYRVLASHLYTLDGKTLPEEERPLFIGGSYMIPRQHFSEAYNYVALGHLHSIQSVSSTITYSGSILPLLPNPAEREKYVQLVDLGEPTSVRAIALGLGDLLEMRTVETMEEALQPVEAGRILYLYFKGIGAPLGSSDIKDLKACHGDSLAAMRVKVREAAPDGQTADEPGEDELSAEEWFRKFYAYKTSGDPPAEVLNLYRRLIALGEEES